MYQSEVGRRVSQKIVDQGLVGKDYTKYTFSRRPSIAAITAIINAYGEVIVEAMNEDKDDFISLGKLGRFKTRRVKGREFNNPICGKTSSDDRNEIIFKVSDLRKRIYD